MSVQSRLQRRIQRYGWDLAAATYEPLWRNQLASAQSEMLALAGLVSGECVLDVACGTGLVTFEAARSVGAFGLVLGVDISGHMVDSARQRAIDAGIPNVRFQRMDAEQLDLPDRKFDVVLCALGLMYVADPVQAVREMHRVLRPGGRLVAAVWGERHRCGWSTVFPIVDAEVHSEVCPLFFQLGQPGMLAAVCSEASLTVTAQCRIDSTLVYEDGDAACDAAFVGGPVALAWSRFDAAARARVRARYLDSIGNWRHGTGYRVPGEFVVLVAQKAPAAA